MNTAAESQSNTHILCTYNVCDIAQATVRRLDIVSSQLVHRDTTAATIMLQLDMCFPVLISETHMAHIVPNPPPKNYRDRVLEKFKVFSKNGEADIIAWGLPHSADDRQFMIAPENTGNNGISHVDSTIAKQAGPYRDLRKFKVKGLRPNDSLAIFRNTNYGTPFDDNWVQHSLAVTVTSVVNDHSAKELADGRLPSYSGNNKIKFYLFGAGQLNPPMKEEDWIKSVTDTLDTIRANALGQKIVQMISSELIIYPWVGSHPNALGDIAFTPRSFNSFLGPGGLKDEVLFHEFIHVIERNFGGYSNAADFKFDGTDFMTVNTTNVYSCLLGRGLRKDHHGFNFLPQEYFDSPRKHFDTFKANYDLAKALVPILYDTLKNASNLWNPFVF